FSAVCFQGIGGIAAEIKGRLGSGKTKSRKRKTADEPRPPPKTFQTGTVIQFEKHGGEQTPPVAFSSYTRLTSKPNCRKLVQRGHGFRDSDGALGHGLARPQSSSKKTDCLATVWRHGNGRGESALANPRLACPRQAIDTKIWKAHPSIAFVK